MSNVPFKLILKIGTPIIMDYQVTLDALLTQALINSGVSEADAVNQVPLEKVEGIYKASSMFCAANFKTVKVTKIMKLGHDDKRKHNFAPNGLRPAGSYAVINQATGPFKNSVTAYEAKYTNEVYFWGVGDPEKVCHLLRNNIIGLGKRWTNGHGQILDIDYVETDEDYSWVTKKHTPARPLPVALWEGDALPTMELAMQFPYWESPKTTAVFPTAWSV